MAARCKLQQAEETSALETDMDDDAGRRRRKKRAQSSSESELSPDKTAKKTKVEMQKKAKSSSTITSGTTCTRHWLVSSFPNILSSVNNNNNLIYNVHGVEQNLRQCE